MDPFDFFFFFLAAVCPYNWGLIWNPNSVKVVQHKTSWSFEEQKPLASEFRLLWYLHIYIVFNSLEQFNVNT